jgi:hypothetical protein
VTVPIPDWATDMDAQWRRRTNQRVVMVQFYVTNLGHHEQWQLIPDEAIGQEFVDGFASAIVSMARAHYEKKWPGTSKDMVCTGGAFWNGGGFDRLVHMESVT